MLRITNVQFNALTQTAHEMVYQLPTARMTHPGFVFAEFEAARSAVSHAFGQANWDGYGALPISEATKANALGALNYLEALTCAPEVTLNTNGTLSFEWETNRGIGQLEIGRTRYSFYVQPTGKAAFVGGGDANEIAPTVGLLVDGVLFPKPSRPVTLTTPAR